MFSEYLQKNNLNAPAFAALIGQSEQAVYKYLRCDRFPRPAVAQKIEKATNGEVTAETMHRAWCAAQTKRKKKAQRQ